MQQAPQSEVACESFSGGFFAYARHQFLFLRLRQPSEPIIDAPVRREFGSQQGVRPYTTMGSRTGPAIVRRVFNQSRRNRISFHIPDCRLQVRVIQGASVKTALPYMSGKGGAAVEIHGIYGMRIPQPTAQGMLLLRNRHLMNMVGHKAIRPQG